MDALPSVVLNAAATFGPFAAVDDQPTPRSRTVGDLLADPDAIGARIDQVWQTLAQQRRIGLLQTERRVAASLFQLGLSARLSTPALAMAALGGWVPDLIPDRVWCDVGAPNPMPVALTEPTGRHVSTPVEAAQAIHDLVVEPLLHPLNEAVAQIGHVSKVVLWGNSWSGLAGSLGPLRPSRPELVTPAVAILRELQRIEATSDAHGDRHPGRYDARGRHHRTSCCLIYRLPGYPPGAPPALCDDCVLRQSGRLDDAAAP